MIRDYLTSDKNSFSTLYIESNIKGQTYLSPEFWQADSQIVVNQYLPQSKTFLYEDQNQIVAAISLRDAECFNLLLRVRMSLGATRQQPPISAAPL